MSNEIKKESFLRYGLQKNKNWLHVPRLKGQEKPTVQIAMNRYNIYSFMKRELEHSKYSSCAMFAHALDGSLCTVVKTTIGEKECYLSNEQDEFKNMYAFRDIASYFCIEKYALIIQIGFADWLVVEE